MAFSSLLCAAVPSALLASSADENVFWPGCWATEREEKHNVRRIATAVKAGTFIPRDLSTFRFVFRMRLLSISKFHDPAETYRQPRLPPPSAASVTTASAPVKSSAAAEAGASARGKASSLSATLVAAEGTRADPALAPGLGVSAGGTVVSAERPGSLTGTIESSATVDSATVRSAAIEIAPVIKRCATGKVSAVVKHGVMVMPVESPMTPAPSETAEPPDSEADSKRKVWPIKPDSRIRIPFRPGHDRSEERR